MKSRSLQTSWLGPDDRFQRLKLLVDFLSDVVDLLVEVGYASFHRARYFADFIADSFVQTSFIVFKVKLMIYVEYRCRSVTLSKRELSKS